MKITIRRKIKSHDRTIGELAIDGKVMADTLELRSIDWSKEKKVSALLYLSVVICNIQKKH